MEKTNSLDINLHPRSNPQNCKFCNKSGHITSISKDILEGIKFTKCKTLNNVLCNLRDILLKKKPCRLSRNNFSLKLRNGEIFYLETCGNIDIDYFFIRFYFGKYEVDTILKSVSYNLNNISSDIIISNSKKILKEIEIFERRKILIVFNKIKLKYLKDLCIYIIDFFEKKVYDIEYNEEYTEMLIKIYPRTSKPHQLTKKKINQLTKRENDVIVIPLIENKEYMFFNDLINISSSIKKIYIEYQNPDFEKECGIDNIDICLLSVISSKIYICINTNKNKLYTIPNIRINGFNNDIYILDNIFNLVQVDSGIRLIYYQGKNLNTHKNYILLKEKYNISRKKIELNKLRGRLSIHQKQI